MKPLSDISDELRINLTELGLERFEVYVINDRIYFKYLHNFLHINVFDIVCKIVKTYNLSSVVECNKITLFRKDENYFFILDELRKKYNKKE